MNHDEEMRAIEQEQVDSEEHMQAVDTANRVVSALLKAVPPDGAKPWQRVACLFTASGEDKGVWGVWATVVYTDQKHGVEFIMKFFGATWREAIEGAVYAIATL